MKLPTLAGLIALAATPALAQTGANPPKIVEPGPPRLTTPGQPPEAVVQGGGAGVANGGPGTTGTLARSGTGADNTSNDTAATSNSPSPERAIPNVGGGGGGNDGGN